jgi:putative redox protein
MAGAVITKWTGELSFDSLVTGHHLKMDGDKEYGGNDTGPRPKPLLLAALTGCSGMDIVSILKKMQVEDYSFEMEADGESTEEHPVVYHTITVKFKFAGENLPQDKIVKAVTLSTDRYCGVNAMLKQAAKVNVQIYINEQELVL